MIRTELFHAMVVHFPIALLMFSFVFFVASRFSRDEAILKISMWSLVVGTLGAVAAVMTGLIAEDLAPHTDKAHTILETFHEPLGLSVMFTSLLLTIWSFAVRWRFKGMMAAAFIIVFSAVIALVALTGHYGSNMVYEHGMAVSPKAFQQVTKPHHHGEEEEHKEETTPEEEQHHDEGTAPHSH
ncbi:MAG: DUF2231 domain-containing protein [bacterium]